MQPSGKICAAVFGRNFVVAIKKKLLMPVVYFVIYFENIYSLRKPPSSKWD